MDYTVLVEDKKSLERAQDLCEEWQRDRWLEIEHNLTAIRKAISAIEDLDYFHLI